MTGAQRWGLGCVRKGQRVWVGLREGQGPESPGGLWVRVLMGRDRGTDIKTPVPPRGTLNVHTEFHFFPAHAGESAMVSWLLPSG